MRAHVHHANATTTSTTTTAGCHVHALTYAKEIESKWHVGGGTGGGSDSSGVVGWIPVHEVVPHAHVHRASRWHCGVAVDIVVAVVVVVAGGTVATDATHHAVSLRGNTTSCPSHVTQRKGLLLLVGLRAGLRLLLLLRRRRHGVPLDRSVRHALLQTTAHLELDRSVQTVNRVVRTILALLLLLLLRVG